LTLKSCRARIRISTRSGRVAGSIRAALAPDLKRLLKDDEGGRAEISLSGSNIIFRVETGDLATLRASVNSYLRLADASYKCITTATTGRQ
jgi:tRNA threonylcarbamoyladenosine modification (KEOPS) complex  Pcc1 subunit